MLDSDYFPDADILLPKNEENIAQFWNRFEKSWLQRRQQLNKGLIEVNVSGTAIENSLLFDDECLEHPEIFEQFNEFAVLVGWEVDA